MDLLEGQRLRVAAGGVIGSFIVAYAAGAALGYSTAQRGVLFLTFVLVVLGWYAYDLVRASTTGAGDS